MRTLLEFRRVLFQSQKDGTITAWSPVPQDSDDHAVIVPSFCAPTRTLAWIEGRAPATISSWSRSSIIFTGRPAFLASCAHATPQVSAPNLLPKPPPITGVSVRTLPAGIFRPVANSPPIPLTFYVEAQTVRLSPSHSVAWPCA